MLLFIKSIYFTAIKMIFRITRRGMMMTGKGDSNMRLKRSAINSPTAAYIAATWASIGVGAISFMIGLWNASIQLNEKGYYLAVFLLGMFSAVTLQKTVRDRAEGIPVTNVFIGMCWAVFSASIALLGIGLFNAQMELSEKGFYAIAFVLSLFSIITVQKNVRDMTNEHGDTDPAAFPSAKSGWDSASEVVDVIDGING